MADFRRYRFGILAAFVMFLFANVFDYVRFSSLIPAYDYEIGYGVPFVFVVSGGFVTEHHIIWSGVAGNLFAVLLLAFAITWVCKRFERTEAR